MQKGFANKVRRKKIHFPNYQSQGSRLELVKFEHFDLCPREINAGHLFQLLLTIRQCQSKDAKANRNKMHTSVFHRSREETMCFQKNGIIINVSSFSKIPHLEINLVYNIFQILDFPRILTSIISYNFCLGLVIFKEKTLIFRIKNGTQISLPLLKTGMRHFVQSH